MSFEHVLEELDHVTWLLEAPAVRKARKARKNQSVRSILRTTVRHLGAVVKQAGPVLTNLDRLRAQLQVSLSTFQSAKEIDRRRLTRNLLKLSALEDDVREMFYPFTKAREGIKTIAQQLEIERAGKRPRRQLGKPVDKTSPSEMYETSIEYAVAMTKSVNELVRQTRGVRTELRRLSKSPTRSPDTEKVINAFLDYRDQFGPLVYRYMGGIKKRLGELHKRFSRGQKSLTFEELTAMDNLLESLVVKLNSPLRKSDAVTRAERRIREKAAKADRFMSRRRKRLREKSRFKNRMKDRLKARQERDKERRKSSLP